MMATFSSSQWRKRLMPLLVVLFPIFCNQLFAEAPFNALITKQSSDNGAIQPQMEKAELALSFSTPTIITNIEDGIEPPPSLILDSLVPSLRKTDYLAQKSSLFRAKKTINFSKEMAKDEKEDRSHLPLIVEQSESSRTIEPSIEQKKTSKNDFLSKKFTIDFANLPANSSTPHAFEYPQSDEAVLIHHNFIHKKSIPAVNFSLTELKITHPISTDLAVETTKGTLHVPTNEKTSKKYFYIGECDVDLENSFPMTSPNALQSHYTLHAQLIKNYVHHKKHLFSQKEAFAEGYYQSFKWPDRSKMTKQKKPLALELCAEAMNAGCSQSEIKTTLQPPESHSLQFKCEKVALPYVTHTQGKKRFISASLDHTTYAVSSHRNNQPIEISKTRDSSEKPTLPRPSKYSLPKGPTIAIELDHGIITLTLTPEFDLYSSKDIMKLPLEGGESPNLFFPSKEQTLSLAFSSALTLETAPETNFESFALSQEPAPFDPILKYPTQPKHHLKTLSSKLSIKKHFVLTKKCFIKDVTVHNDYLPSVQKTEKTCSTTHFRFSLPKSQSTLFTLGSEQNLSIELTDAKVHHKKYTHRERSKINLNELRLPGTKRELLSPKEKDWIPHVLMHAIPHLEEIVALVKHTKSALKEHIPSLDFLNANPFCLSNTHPLLNPPLPDYYHPKALGLDIIATAPSIRKKHLEYAKKKLAPVESSLANLILPYVARKKILLKKVVMTPQKACEDLPDANKGLGLASHHKLSPNTRELLQEHPVPIKIQSKHISARGSFSPFTTDITRYSQSKKMLDDYHEETLVSSEPIALISAELEGGPSNADKHIFNQANRFTNAFLTEIPPPSSLETISYDNEFNTSIHYSKRENGKGYLFSIQMKPTENLNFASPHQHYIFVVDGSSSIKQHRFGVFKEGVGRALSYLGTGDSFNIIIADSKIIPFSQNPVPCSKTSISNAKRFLMGQNYRGFFINYNAFSLISKVSHYCSPDKENIVILITDGHSLSSLQDHKNDFKALVKKSKGKFSVFTATASQENNLSMLNLLSTFNNGELMYAKTNASFSRQLSVLVKHIESFVAKDIHVTVTSISKETGVKFYSNKTTLPSLYADRPYIVYGTIDKLKDFDLILQGRCGDKWVNIKQKVSFQHAEKAPHSIKKKIALQQAYISYDHFLQNNDPFFLKEAQNILECIHIPTAIQ